MDSSGIYLTASSAAGTNPNLAVAKLSESIDLNADEYEIGLIYCSVLSSWLYNDDLWLIQTSSETQKSEIIRFDKIPYTKEHEALWLLSNRILSEYGGNMNTAPLKIYRNNKTSQWNMRLPKKCMVDLSPDLASMLGLPNIIRNETDRVMDKKITFTIYAPFLDQRLFFVSCNQTIQNFTNAFGSNNRILSFIHAAETDPYLISDYTAPRLGYVRLEGSLLTHITFSLLNHIGQVVKLQKHNFFVVFHIRPVRKNGR